MWSIKKVFKILGSFKENFYICIVHSRQPLNFKLSGVFLGGKQTIGWQDYNKAGSMGTFDPLDESNDNTAE